jgi:hypothetical protein
MLESAVNLLNGLFLIAVTLLMVVCIVGSIVAALLAVSRGTAASESIQGKRVDDVGTRTGALLRGNSGRDFTVSQR